MMVIRATFGAKDNSHALLESDCDPKVLPPTLANLTDRPPGDFAPGEVWFPSVGCCPIGDWWGLWWTEPDQEASRAGMVRSQVALWRRDEIAKLSDLEPILCELSGKDSLTHLPENELAQIAHELLNSPKTCVLVCNSLDEWPSVLLGIWPRLWPQAKEKFSARLALSPPQNAAQSNSVSLFCIPNSREHQWQSPYHKIKTNVAGTLELPSRAAKYLAGAHDETMDEVLSVIPALESDLKKLTRVARIATNIDAIRAQVDFKAASSLLRALEMLPPGTEEQFKSEAITALSKAMPAATLPNTLSIANIFLPDLPETSSLTEALKLKASDLFVTLEASETTELIKKLPVGEAQPWWQAAVRTALSEGIKSLLPVWLSTAHNWLIVDSLGNVVIDELPHNSELKILEIAQDRACSESEASLLRQHALRKQWPVLHAWTLVAHSSASEAFDTQYKFPGNALPGIEYLAERLPVGDVVIEALKKKDKTLINLAAKRTVEHPDSLKYIDISQPESRILWKSHIRLGGIKFPKSLANKGIEEDLIDIVLSGEDSNGLIVLIAEELAQFALIHPRRESLWSKLDHNELAMLLPRVAEEFIKDSMSPDVIIEPETELAEAVLQIIRQIHQSATVLRKIIGWSVVCDENEAMDWVRRFTPSDWENAGSHVANAVVAKRWHEIAQLIVSVAETTPEAKLSADTCRSLARPTVPFNIDFFNPFRYFKFNNETTLDPLVKKVADVGAKIEPTGLEHIWYRAGGRIQDLMHSGTPTQNWQNAARKAKHGALPNGLLSLVEELKHEYPSNTELNQLTALLNEKS